MKWFFFLWMNLFSVVWAQPRSEQDSVTIHGHEIFVELARTPEEWMHGLMFREKMAEHSGMLFVGQDDRRRSFWMKNTLIPLDIIFIDSQWKIVSIAENAEPLTETPRPSLEPARHVLEINGGLSKKWDLKKGMRLILNPILKKKIK